jgi:starvation-inducible DNA-binding protein
MKHQENPSTEASRRAAPPESESPNRSKAVKAPESGVAGVLNALLADEFVLYTKTLNCHWNVRGMQFHSLHAFFEKLYLEQLQAADDVAERIRTVGGTALGSMTEFLKSARLKELTGPPPDPRSMIISLVADYESILGFLRDGIEAMEQEFNDPGTCNFLTELLEQHEKAAWMLRVHLDKDLN